jgi:solute carrier family 13 (sodium-dependent dicarboxylate transporter), member 2/3/5
VSDSDESSANPVAGEVVDVHPKRLLLGFVVAVGLGFASLWLPFESGVASTGGALAVGVTGLTAWCWLTRCLPLAPASLIPLALFPLLGISSTKSVATAYAHPILWLFFGGFVLAMAIERWGLHRRLALHIIARVGLRPRRLVLGFIAAGLFLSMWISNTATSLMLLPIGVALIDRVRKLGVLGDAASKRLSTALLLGLAYGCSLGGMATPIGTAPNLLFLASYQEAVAPNAPDFSFPQWIALMLPIAILFAVIVWACLVFFTFKLPKGDARSGELIREELRSLPRLSSAEKRLLMVFGLAVLLWVTRKDVPLSSGHVIPGWSTLLGFTGATKNFVQDGSVAVLMAILTFFIPSGDRGSPPLMDWKTARGLPFDILFLLGGGIAIAAVLEQSGVCGAMANVLKPLVENVHPFFAVLLTVAMMTFLTEVTSNTATTALMLPILSVTSVAAGLDPRLLMLPATIAASCAFMLPIATPPNAVVFASGRLRMGEMVRAGFLLNLISIALLSLATWFGLVPALGIEPNTVPEWWLRR